MTECPVCHCTAPHSRDTTTPEVTWCSRCTGCCWNPLPEPVVVEKEMFGTTDFGFGWAGEQLRKMLRKGFSWVTVDA